MSDDGCSYCGFYFMMHVNQIIILYTLILHNALWKKVKVLVYQQCPTLCDCIDCSPETPWNSPDKNIAVGSHFLIQGIFPSQGLNPGLLHWRQIFQHLSQQRSRLYFKTQKKLIKWKKIPCVWIWIYLGYYALIRYIIYKHFFHSASPLFILLMISLNPQQFFF